MPLFVPSRVTEGGPWPCHRLMTTIHATEAHYIRCLCSNYAQARDPRYTPRLTARVRPRLSVCVCVCVYVSCFHAITEALLNMGLGVCDCICLSMCVHDWVCVCVHDLGAIMAGGPPLRRARCGTATARVGHPGLCAYPVCMRVCVCVCVCVRRERNLHCVHMPACARV
jgi:hypothetical protein